MLTDAAHPHPSAERSTAPTDLVHSLVALLGRFSIAATFWASGQTKIEGFVVDLVNGDIELGVPRLAESTVELFAYEYALPLIDPYPAAVLASVAEHVLPLLLLLGAATRFSALGLLVITAVIQIFVYPQAYALHGTWATILIYLAIVGGGRLSVDHLLQGRVGAYLPWRRRAR
jgi:putative oxidoreductase